MKEFFLKSALSFIEIILHTPDPIMGFRRLFFQGRVKISQGGGQEPTFCLKNKKKILFSPKTSKNIPFLASLGGGARASLAPPPADAHESHPKSRNVIWKPKCSLSLPAKQLDYKHLNCFVSVKPETVLFNIWKKLYFQEIAKLNKKKMKKYAFTS
jgi:hypothetical protein